MKKIAAIIFAMILFFAVADIMTTDILNVKASETEQATDENYTSGSALHINPLYEDIIDENDIPSSYTLKSTRLFSSPEYTTSTNDIVKDIRTGMRERQNKIIVYFAKEGKLLQSDVENWVYAAFEETDHPKEGDYIRWGYTYVSMDWQGNSLDGITWNYTVSFNVGYYTNGQQEAVLDAEVEKVFTELGISSSNSDYKNLKLLYDYVCDNISYDLENLYNEEHLLKYTAYAALINKTAVCQGYAQLMYYMGEKAGIDMRLIAGQSFGENHGWNIAKLGNKYYYLDATWDAGQTTYSYFLKGKNYFANHTSFSDYTTTEFKSKYPISTTNYVPKYTVTYDDFVFEVDCDYVTLISYQGNAEDVVIPAVIEELPVSAIRTGTFKDNPFIKRIIIPESIQRIDEQIIAGCDSLTDIYYLGTKESFALIDIETNDALNAIYIHCSDDSDSSNCEHTWEAISVIEEPSCINTGLQKVICDNCEEVRFDILEMTDHTYVWITDKCASEIMKGKKHEVCTVCDELRNQNTVIETVSSQIKYTKMSYTGEKRKPSVTVVDAAGNVLTEGIDYTLSGDTSVSAVGRYYVKVKYCGDYTGSKTFYYTIVPAKVTSFDAELSGGHNDVKISWTKSAGASGYYVSYKKATSSTYSSQKRTSKNYYTFSDLSSNTDYDFRVVPYYLEDDTKYYLSSEYEYDTLKTKKYIKAPSLIAGYLFVNHDDIRISWSKSTGAAGYNVYYKTASDENYQFLDSTTTRNTEKAKDLRDGVKYTFRVVPYYMDGDEKVEGYYGKVKSVYTLKKLNLPTVSRYNSSKVRVKWNNISGETGYQIARASTEDGTYSIISTYETTSGKSKVVSAKKNRTYFYKVRAYKTVDGKKIYGPWSDIVEYKLK